MNSSGIKRGLAATAISALAVTGLPFLALSASAEPIADQFGDPDEIAFYSVNTAGNTFSPKNDGTNTSVSLVVGGGANVTSVLYQYEQATAPGTWTNVGPAVGRNADGVFALDWAAPPSNVSAIRAVPNTGIGETVTKTPAANLGAASNTVELASEGALGVFQSPYDDADGADDIGGNADDEPLGEYVGVTGTVSQGSAAPTVSDASHGTAGSDDTTLETTTNTASDDFNSVLDIDGYVYSGGTDPNQIAINAATNNTDDAEASTLYVQTIGSITATPATQDDPTPGDAEVDITVLDTTGEPVANAQVYRGGDTDTDGGGADTDTDGPNVLVGYTDGRGMIKDVVVGGATSVVYYANTTNNDAYQPGTDPATTATVTTYTPALSSVDIVNERDRADFDLDELNDPDADDFTIETRDQRGNLFNETVAGNDVEYRWVVDPDAAGETTQTSNWLGDAYLVDNGDGTYSVDELTDTDWNDNTQFPTATTADLPIGTYTLEARRPNVGGTGLTNATPETFRAGESDIAFDEGTRAVAPVNGEFTAEGQLTNDDGTPLAGREIELDWSPTGDATVAPQSSQPSGTTYNGPFSATAVTDDEGRFAVVLTDPDVPDNVDPVEENGGELEAYAIEAPGEGWYLWDNNGPDDTGPNNGPSANAAATLEVNFQEAAEVGRIDVDIDDLLGGPAPGRPVDVDIIAYEEDGDANPGNDVELQDFQVQVSVDKGFLSPHADTAEDLTLDEAHDEEGDLFGFFQNDGTEQTVSTGDDAEAGIVAAIERDEDFDDNGLTEMTITVTAGDVTEEFEVEFDATDVLNLVEGEMPRAAGEPAGPVAPGNEVDHQLYTYDQFGNLVGDQDANVTDDSTVADFRTDGDFGDTRTDFTVSGAGITAFSEGETTQVLTARVDGNQAYVDEFASYDGEDNDTLAVDSAPIEWVAGEEVKRINPGLVVRGRNNGGRNDKVVARAINLTEGATVRLFKKTKKGLRLLQTATMNSKGNHKFTGINDKNGRKYTKYVVKVEKTDMTKRGRGAKRIR